MGEEEDNEFHVILASNVAPNTFSNNKPNHFYTPLSRPLLFDVNSQWKVALKEITYHNTLMSVVNESIEVWQENTEEWDVLDTLVVDTTKFSNDQISQFSETLINSTAISASISLGTCTIFFNRTASEPLLQKYGKLMLNVDIRVSDYHVTDLNTNASYAVESRRLNTVILRARPLPKLQHTAFPKSKNYDSPTSLCKELNRVLKSDYFGIETESNLFRVESLPKNFKLV